jgi:hypothetical protein
MLKRLPLLLPPMPPSFCEVDAAAVLLLLQRTR